MDRLDYDLGGAPSCIVAFQKHLKVGVLLCPLGAHAFEKFTNALFVEDQIRDAFSSRLRGSFKD